MNYKQTQIILASVLTLVVCNYLQSVAAKPLQQQNFPKTDSLLSFASSQEVIRGNIGENT
jgi:hypothetical protein